MAGVVTINVRLSENKSEVVKYKSRVACSAARKDLRLWFGPGSLSAADREDVWLSSIDQLEPGQGYIYKIAPAAAAADTTYDSQSWQKLKDRVHAWSQKWADLAVTCGPQGPADNAFGKKAA